MKKKVAIQGIAGSYHDIAARNYFEGEEIEIIGCNTFRDVISTIKKDPSILGMMAIENTIAGSLLQNHELIRESGLQVIGEYKLRISHSLVALPGPSHRVQKIPPIFNFTLKSDTLSINSSVDLIPCKLYASAQIGM